jgi:hypothetical protein
MPPQFHPWQAQQGPAGALIPGGRESHHVTLVILTPSCLDPSNHVKQRSQDRLLPQLGGGQLGRWPSPALEGQD